MGRHSPGVMGRAAEQTPITGASISAIANQDRLGSIGWHPNSGTQSVGVVVTDTYNRMPAEAKAEALKKLREHIKRDLQGLEQFTKERSVIRGGGRSLGGSSEREMKLKRSRDKDRDQEWER